MNSNHRHSRGSRPGVRAIGLALAALVLALSSVAVAYTCPQTPSPAKTETYQGFLGRVQKLDGEELPYRLFVPKDYDANKAYPLVLYLHHAGLAGGDTTNNKSGWDNCVQLTSEIGSGDDYGGVFTHRAVDKAGARFDTQQRYPHFVLAPHANTSNYGFGGGVAGSASAKEHPTRRVLWAILDAVKAEFNIDPARLYVTGISMGCYGTWDIIMRSPGVFAAASPQSCRGDPDAKLLAPLKSMPIWSMCGTKDSYFSGAQAMADGMKQVGATAFEFTAMDGVGHSINDRGYDYPGFIDWMFAQHLTTVPASGGSGSGGSGGAASAGNSGAGGAGSGGAPTGGVSGQSDGGGMSASGSSAVGGGSAMGGSAVVGEAGTSGSGATVPVPGSVNAMETEATSAGSCSLGSSAPSGNPAAALGVLVVLATLRRSRRGASIQ